MRGNVSGRQDIEYNGGDAYAIADGQQLSADNYAPRFVTKVMDLGKFGREKHYFQVRTKTTVNMTPAMRENLAVLGGAGAIFAALVKMKTSAIYAECVACARESDKNITLRAFVVPRLMDGLRHKDTDIYIGEYSGGDVYIDNPWTTSGTPNVPVTANILNKFNDVLSL